MHIHVQVYSVHIDYTVRDPYCLLYYGPLFSAWYCWLLDCLKKKPALVKNSYNTAHVHASFDLDVHTCTMYLLS